TQPPRALAVGRRGETSETLAVVPVRRGREQAAGAFVVDTIGPLGLGLRRGTVALPWDAAVYPPLVTVRLRASVARAARRQQGVTPIRQLGEGRLFESLREWVPGDDLRHIDWKATAKRRKVITRQYEAERRQQVRLVLDTGPHRALHRRDRPVRLRCPGRERGQPAAAPPAARGDAAEPGGRRRRGAPAQHDARRVSQGGGRRAAARPGGGARPHAARRRAGARRAPRAGRLRRGGQIPGLETPRATVIGAVVARQDRSL